MNVDGELKRLSGLSLPALREEFARVCGEPARSNNKVFLVKRIAWWLQARASGGLSAAAVAKAHELAESSQVRERPPREVHAVYAGLDAQPRPAYTPPPGSILTRCYRGREIVVRVLENGFEYDGDRFGSLSAVAKRVTGSSWNGRLFFGLTPRGGAR